MKKENISLTESFITLSRLFVQKHHQMGASHLHDPYRGQGRILFLLKMQPEMSQKELSYLLGIRPQSMGELLTKLEQNGYITRATSVEDKRAIDIKLTDEGAKVAAENEQRRAQELAADEMFQCLNKEEQEILAGYLNRIIFTLKETLGGEQIDFLGHGGGPHARCFAGPHMEFGRHGREDF